MLPGPKTTANLQTVSTTSDSMGGFTESWTTIKTISGILTRPSKGNQTERDVGEKQTLIADYVFFMDFDSSLSFSEKDRVVIGTRNFDILWIYNPGNANHHLELYIREIK